MHRRVESEGRIQRIIIEYDTPAAQPPPAKPGKPKRLPGAALFLLALLAVAIAWFLLSNLSWPQLLPFLLAALGGVLHELLQSGTIALPKVVEGEVYLGHLGGAAIGVVSQLLVVAGGVAADPTSSQALAAAVVTGLSAKGASGSERVAAGGARRDEPRRRAVLTLTSARPSASASPAGTCP